MELLCSLGQREKAPEGNPFSLEKALIPAKEVAGPTEGVRGWEDGGWAAADTVVSRIIPLQRGGCFPHSFIHRLTCSFIYLFYSHLRICLERKWGEKETET